MNNEIRFRIWDKNTKCFVSNPEDYFINSLGHIYYSAAGLLNYLYRHDLEISQFTGLKDENNREICCGDIVSAFHRGPSLQKYTIEFDLGCFGFRDDNDKQGTDFYPLYELENITVIGNIYEGEK